MIIKAFMNKINFRKIFLNIFKLVLVIIILFAIINVSYRKYEEKILKDDVSKLLARDFTNDNINIEAKTVFKYREVVEVMQKYLNDYSNNVKEVLYLVNDDKLKSILSAANYASDGPLFANTISYLTSTKDKINNSIDSLAKFTKEDVILSYINSSLLSDYYKNLYNKYMLSYEFKQEIDKSVNELKKSLENVNTLIDKERVVIDFLINCKNWTIKDNSILFLYEADLLKYNNLIGEM